jgi:GWxTD domain-containing protein
VRLAALPSPKTFQDWIKSPEAYYATQEEREEWARIGTEEDATRFIAMYWARRGEGFRLDVQRRIEFAERKFAVGSTPGSRTARGRVWMLLGSPNIERRERTSGRTGDIGSTGPNIFERQSVVRTLWIYKAERLPPEFGIPELTVQFQTDVSRGSEIIENPAAVEPHLAKAAELSRRSAPGEPVLSRGPIEDVEKDVRGMVDPLWKAGDALGGARFSGETCWNPKGEPFYAFQIFLPRGEKRFAELKSALFVGIVRDLAGTEVAVLRENAELSASRDGDRSFEKSIVLANGRYKAVLALLTPDGRGLLSGIGTEFELLPVPQEFHVSALHMTNNVISLEAPPRPFEPFVFGGGKYVPKGDGRFSAKDKVGYFVVIRNPDGEPEPSVSIRMTLYKDGQPFVRTPAEPAELVKVGEHAYLNANAFEVGTFSPGRYRFIVLFRDLKASHDSAPWKEGKSVSTEFEVAPEAAASPR